MSDNKSFRFMALCFNVPFIVTFYLMPQPWIEGSG